MKNLILLISLIFICACGGKESKKSALQGEWQLRASRSFMGLADLSQNQTLYFLPEGRLMMAHFDSRKRPSFEPGSWSLEGDIIRLTLGEDDDLEIEAKMREQENGDFQLIGMGDKADVEMSLIPIRINLESNAAFDTEDLTIKLVNAGNNDLAWNAYHLIYPVYFEDYDFEARVEIVEDLITDDYWVKEITECYESDQLVSIDEDMYSEFKERVNRMIEDEELASDHHLAKVVREDIIYCDEFDIPMIRYQDNWYLLPVK